jgi:hypothetical protein
VVGYIVMKRVQLKHAANVTRLVVQSPSCDYSWISEWLSLLKLETHYQDPQICVWCDVRTSRVVLEHTTLRSVSLGLGPGVERGFWRGGNTFSVLCLEFHIVVCQSVSVLENIKILITNY